MELFLQTDIQTLNATAGTLFADGMRMNYTLEDAVREIPGVPVEQWKIAKRTAIPSGRYRVILSRSERFSQHASLKLGRPVDVILPEVLDVPGFSGVRLHGGNGPDDTEGCPLNGENRIGDERIANCAPAMERLIQKIKTAIDAGDEVWLTVDKRQAAA